MDLSRDFREFFESLDRNEVRYLVLGGMQVPVIGLAALIQNKTAAGRDQDLVDVKVLRRILER